MEDSDIIDVPELPEMMRYTVMSKTGLNMTLDEIETEHIKNVLDSVKGNKTKASEILGIDRRKS